MNNALLQIQVSVVRNHTWGLSIESFEAGVFKLSLRDLRCWDKTEDSTVECHHILQHT